MPTSSYLLILSRPKYLLIFAFIFAACTTKSVNNKWSTVIIDPKISDNEVYVQLDKEGEIFSALEDHKTDMKRTSGVSYFTGMDSSSWENKFSNLNNCRAYFISPDTLKINVGIGSGFGGRGFIISYSERKFYTEPYFYTDVIDPNESEPTYNLVYQKLTLDKPKYEIGDSLYGQIDFKSIEISKQIKIEHSGKGYFRTEIKNFLSR